MMNQFSVLDSLCHPPPPQLPTPHPYLKEKKRKITRPTCVNKVTPDCLLSLPFLPYRCTEFPVSSPGSCQFSKVKSKKKKEKNRRKNEEKEEEKKKRRKEKKKRKTNKPTKKKQKKQQQQKTTLCDKSAS